MSFRPGPRLVPPLFFGLLAACGSSFSEAGDGGPSKDGSSTSDGLPSPDGGPDTSPLDSTPGDSAPHDAHVGDARNEPFPCGDKTCSAGIDYCEEFVPLDSLATYGCPPTTCDSKSGCSCQRNQSQTLHPHAKCSIESEPDPGECYITCEQEVIDDGGLGSLDAPIITKDAK
jgi:hypothetical protein